MTMTSTEPRPFSPVLIEFLLWNAISTLDVLSSFATVAVDLNYTMPIVDNSGEINIKEGRHPVIEKMMPSGSFIPNDTYLNKDENRLSIINFQDSCDKYEKTNISHND